MSYQPNARDARWRWRMELVRRPALLLATGLIWFSLPAVARSQGVGADQQDSSGVLAGELKGFDAGEPIGYATVDLVNIGRASFADAKGTFRLSRLIPGQYHLRARQIGYAPLDTTVEVDPGPGETTLSLRLHRVALKLARVSVIGRRGKGCVATGVPDSLVNPALAAIFGQVRENVDRLRLLLDEYPFQYTREERHFDRSDPGGDSTVAVDTVGYDSRARRAYKVGDVVYLDYDPVGRRTWYMYLPTFRDLADPAFLAAHCFSYGGTEDLGGHGAQVLRVDFQPAGRISVPDVEGSVYLDAHSFIVRRAVFRLTKPGAAKPPILGLAVTTSFRELAPLVPVFDSVESDQQLPVGSTTNGHGMSGARTTVIRSAIEDDHLLGFTFERRTLGDSAAARAVAAPSASAPANPVPAVVSARSASSPLVKGRVAQPDGTPVAGATVGLVGMRDTATTSDSGTFALAGASPGPHMLVVRRLGFEPTRTAVTVSVEHASPVTLTLVRSVPVLATVVTTAEKRGYHEIGLDRRMKAGAGQYLTYQQIERRQASKLSQLLNGMRGIEVRQDAKNFNPTVEGTRGVASCVGFVVDGVPQAQLASTTVMGSVLAPDDADNLIEPSAIAAIEVYSSSERPVEFGAGLEERPPTPPGQPLPAIDLSAQQCNLVVIWTKARLGIPPSATPAAAGDQSAARARPVFPNVAMCEPPPADDTVALAVVAALQTGQGGGPSDAAWSAYLNGVLSAVRNAFVMPTDLPLGVFGYPFKESAPISKSASGASTAAAPGFATVVVFSLDSAGGVSRLRVAASSLSGMLDTTILAAVSDAALAHTFPRLPASHRADGPMRIDLIVSTGQGTVGGHSAILGHFFAPMWPLRRPASLADGTQPNLATDVGPTRIGSDSVTLEFVVNEQGRAAMSTVRAVGLATGSESDGADRAFLGRVVHALPGFRFQPALIGACPVRQMMIAGFSLHGAIGAMPGIH